MSAGSRVIDKAMQSRFSWLKVCKVCDAEPVLLLSEFDALLRRSVRGLGTKNSQHLPPSSCCIKLLKLTFLKMNYKIVLVSACCTLPMWLGSTLLQKCQVRSGQDVFLDLCSSYMFAIYLHNVLISILHSAVLLLLQLSAQHQTSNTFLPFSCMNETDLTTDNNDINQHVMWVSCKMFNFRSHWAGTDTHPQCRGWHLSAYWWRPHWINPRWFSPPQWSPPKGHRETEFKVQLRSAICFGLDSQNRLYPHMKQTEAHPNIAFCGATKSKSWHHKQMQKHTEGLVTAQKLVNVQW